MLVLFFDRMNGMDRMTTLPWRRSCQANRERILSIPFHPVKEEEQSAIVPS
jgi:hypothetical protein